MTVNLVWLMFVFTLVQTKCGSTQAGPAQQSTHSMKRSLSRWLLEQLTRVMCRFGGVNHQLFKYQQVSCANLTFSHLVLVSKTTNQPDSILNLNTSASTAEAVYTTFSSHHVITHPFISQTLLGGEDICGDHTYYITPNTFDSNYNLAS